MTEYFDLPDENNSITYVDISKGILRITVHAKPFFTDIEQIWLTIGENKYLLNYTKRTGRSDQLHLGKSLMTANSIQASSRLRFTKIRNGEFRLENLSNPFPSAETEQITFEQLTSLKNKYWSLLKSFPFPTPPREGDAASMIRYFKRLDPNNHHQIGPYYRLTVFEAANRIATDLVIINGVMQLIRTEREPRDSIITVRLGNKHVKGSGDFIINGKEGQAFNVASSFFKVKFRLTNQKWQSGNLEYILVNGEIFEEFNHTETDPKLIKVDNWDKE